LDPVRESAPDTSGIELEMAREILAALELELDQAKE
jgi:hypothetical protein